MNSPAVGHNGTTVALAYYDDLIDSWTPPLKKPPDRSSLLELPLLFHHPTTVRTTENDL